MDKETSQTEVLSSKLDLGLFSPKSGADAKLPLLSSENRWVAIIVDYHRTSWN
jgi:hypothetical protein